MFSYNYADIYHGWIQIFLTDEKTPAWPGTGTMIISHNLMAMNANRMLGITTGNQSKRTEKLSSGYKINRAADDAAGLAISEKMRRQIRGLTQASSNVEEGIGYVQTADGALNETHDILQRMNELAVKSANGTLEDDDRSYIDSELSSLKDELDRIFDTTTFNEIKIWEPQGEKTIIGYEKVTAVTSTSTRTSYDISNKNCGIQPSSSIKVSAVNPDGISLSWTGYDGKSYETGKISLEDLKANNYSFKMSDLYGDDDSFYDTTVDPKTPLIDRTLSFKVADAATDDDIVASLNGSTIYTSAGVNLSSQFETSDGTKKSSDIGSSASLYYNSAYQSFANGDHAFSFDEGVDDFITPTINSDGGNVTVASDYASLTVDYAKTSNDTFSLNFNMTGVGTVTGKLGSVYYTANDRSDETENIFWSWATLTDGTRYISARTISAGNDLSAIMSALTGDASDKTPGLLSSANGGLSNNGGTITLQFPLTSSSGTSVGNVNVTVDVSSTDTEETILKKVQDNLNGSTILDLFTTSGNVNGSYGGIYNFSPYVNKIDSPIYKATNTFYVQSGTEKGQQIDVYYDALNTTVLGIKNTTVKTADEAKSALADIKGALKVISEQRSVFGSYQNRLEHAVKSLDNTVENTTSAESEIRDTDMAEEMVAYSINNILSQAGQAMLAQANQSNQNVLELLR